MKLPRKFVILSLLLCWSAIALASVNNYPYKYYFRHIDRHNGLSQNEVKCIIQDFQGFMWFGTKNRLNRYDGNSIRTFDCSDQKLGKRNNNISYIYEDKRQRLWVGTDKGVFIFTPKDEKFTFLDASTSNKVKINDWIASITEDQYGYYWIIAPNEGIFRYQEVGKLEQYHIGNPKQPDHGTPQCMCVDRSGHLWVGTSGSGVYLYDQSHNKFIQYLGNNNGSTLEKENIYCMCDYGSELVLGIHEGKLRRFNKRRNEVSDFNTPDIHYKIIRDVKNFDGTLWIGTDAGLFVYNELRNTLQHIHNDPMNNSSLADNHISKIYRDKENGIWVGTRLNGLSYLPQKGMEFISYTPLSSKFTINSKSIREIGEDLNGNIWVGTDDDGINIFNPLAGTFKTLGKDLGSALTSGKTLSMLFLGNEVWVGLFKNGLDVVNTSSFSVNHYSKEALGLGNEGSIYASCEDFRGNIWIGNGWGVYVGNREDMKFTRMEQFGFNYIYDILEDSEKNIWVATMGNGVFCYNPMTKALKHYVHNDNDKNSLSSNSVSSITETSSGKIWFSTDRGGICRYNSNGTFTTVSIEQGLPDDTGYKILEDNQGYLWFGTNNGLIKLNPETFKFTVYDTQSGYPCGQFNYKSAFKSKDGVFYFGSTDGLISFNPSFNNKNTIAPQVYITRLFVDNKEIVPNEDSPLQEGLSFTDEITLDYTQTNIRIEFAALSYVMPSANTYCYKLDGVDADWVTTHNVNGVSYNNLAPGKYTFHLKGSNSDGVFNSKETTFEIIILPPWWRSTVAILIYIILFGVALWYLINYFKKRTIEKEKEKNRLAEAEKDKELYQQKIDFFTSIAHEIRTPVTLINGPLENLKDMEIADPEILRDLKTMSRNTNDLMDLINQLLDFRKIDNNNMKVNLVSVNLSALLRDRRSNYDYLTTTNARVINTDMPKEDVFVIADRNMIIKILNNLYSNAVKYSEKEINISLKSENDKAVLTITNDGPTVPKEAQNKIFDAFFQLPKNENTPSSTGIGLYISRSLVESNNGSLNYSIRDGLNCFELILNINKTQDDTIDKDKNFISEEMGDNETPETDTKQIGTLLIVEDNVELIDFLEKRFQSNFNVVKASDGQEALQKLKETNVDIVISDIMMPNMNGIELCQTIKADIDLCHIPVILLTAKGDLESKIEGLESGADAYVVKPFSFKYLMAQVVSIAENRKRDQEAFMHKPFMPTKKMGMSKADAKLLEDMVRIIEENIDSPNFSVEMLAELTCMSRSSLHRKIKAITETSPTDFIKLIRLKKASELIAEGSYRVGEVCYMVGINSPSYFIRLFQKQFGMTPKEFEKQMKRKKEEKEDTDNN